MPAQQYKDKDKDAAVYWQPFDDGRTINTRGEEYGTIIFDLEHRNGARITIEKNASSAPFVTTVAICNIKYHGSRYDMKETDALNFARRTTKKINILFDHLTVPKNKRDLLWEEKYDTLTHGLTGV